MTADPDPHGLLLKCHPDLLRLAYTAYHKIQGWQVDYGLRTIQAEEQAVATGHSETLHSRHLPDAHFNGDAMAFDFFVIGANGQPDWTVPGRYPEIGNAILAVAAKLGIKAQWGGELVGAWTDGVVSHFRDWGHIQLDPSAYA